MKRTSVISGLLFLVGCLGGTETLKIPGIGIDPNQSTSQDVEYRLLLLGTGCEADLFSTMVTISQAGQDLTAESEGQIVATATIDSSGNVTAHLISPSPPFSDLDCTGLFNEGTFDMTCPYEGGSCDFIYVRSDLEVEVTR